jgi:hypothetical protein
MSHMAPLSGIPFSVVEYRGASSPPVSYNICKKLATTHPLSNNRRYLLTILTASVKSRCKLVVPTTFLFLFSFLLSVRPSSSCTGIKSREGVAWYIFRPRSGAFQPVRSLEVVSKSEKKKQNVSENRPHTKFLDDEIQ